MNHNRPLNVLLIEDHPADIRLIQAMFSGQSRVRINLKSEFTFSEGLSHLSTEKTDAVIMDLSLPDTEGLDSLLILSKVAPTVPIIVLTGLDDDQLIDDALHLGAQDYLIKGTFDGEMIARSIHHAVERQRLRVELNSQYQELHVSRSRFRSLITDNADAIIVVDSEGVLRFINPAGEAMLGRSAEKMIGADWGIPLEGTATAEIDLVRPDGEKIEVDMRVMKTLWDGNPAFIATMRDVMDRKRAERSLRVAKQAAETANHMKSMFLADMSHELRTPLNSIIGFSQMMMHETFGELGHNKYNEYIADIHNSGSHLLSLINDLLDFSKIEAGRFDLNKQAFLFDEMIHSTVQSVSLNAEQKGVAIEADFGHPAISTDGDEFRLRQVLLNILSNAIKFTPEGGKVTVSMPPRTDNRIVVLVKDTGIGMRPEQIPAAFLAFNQIDNAYTRDSHDGTGLGLPLAKKLVELHGGTIRITSELGVGTEVAITLPKTSQPFFELPAEDDAEPADSERENAVSELLSNTTVGLPN